MKKAALFILFAFAAALPASLAAQQTEIYHETRIYVPPIDGIGMIDDMAYFYKQITGEIVRQYRTLGKTRRTSDYVITGRIMPLAEEGIDMSMLPPGSENDENILYIELFNNAMGETIGAQFITYSIPDMTTEESLSVIIYNMLAGVPDLLEGMASYETWRHKWLYANLNFLWTPRVYTGIYQSVNIASVGAEAMADFHFLPYLSLRLGAEIVQDWVVVHTASNESYSDMILDIPVAVSFVFRPQEIFMLQPYLGVTYNVSLLNTTRPFPLSWMAGVEWGIKLGPGIFTLEPRFAMDFGRSQIVGRNAEYWRYTIHLGIGYKIGFFDRNQ
jgi:hypothetical protein